MVFRQREGAKDKAYHNPIGAFLYNVLFLAKHFMVMRSLRSTNGISGSPVAVGSTIKP